MSPAKFMGFVRVLRCMDSPEYHMGAAFACQTCRFCSRGERSSCGYFGSLAILVGAEANAQLQLTILPDRA